MYLPPRLTSDRVSTTYCFHDCLQLFMKNLSTIRIFSILRFHTINVLLTYSSLLSIAHFVRIIDRNPFIYHRRNVLLKNHIQQFNHQINNINLLVFNWKWFQSTYSRWIQFNDEMCQAFLYYYPKNSSFSLCPRCAFVSMWLGSNFTNNALDDNWTVNFRYRSQYRPANLKVKSAYLKLRWCISEFLSRWFDHWGSIWMT